MTSTAIAQLPAGALAPRAATLTSLVTPPAPVWRRIGEEYAQFIIRKPAPPAQKLPDPRQWTAILSRAVVEVLTGLRACNQLDRWVSPSIYAALARRTALAQRLNRTQATKPASVLSAHVQSVAPGIVEASAAIHDGERIRVVAMRLIATRNHWEATALEVG